MSSPAKTIVLRAVLPNDASAKTTLALGTLGKTESKNVTLTSGEMTTEALVGHIKELSKLRDEILQVMRQLNLTRKAAPSPVDQLDFDKELESTRRELDEARDMYQEIQGRIENIQRQIDDSKKKITALTEISQTGFATDQLESDAEDFRRALGRLPVKKLEAAQKVLQSQFKDQAILAVGNRKQDIFYILVAAPKDEYSRALQTLLLYDFTPIEIPEYKSPDVKSEIQTEEERRKVLAKEVDEIKLQLDELRKKAEVTLNQRLDEVVDALMLLRAILKLGEGTQASRIYVQVERVFPPETVKNLSRRGIIELESSL
jgi:predicted translin family RNA/ssDNA-binding protein